MYTCVRSLIFGEDFSSDPVSRALGLIVRKSSGGQVQVDTAMLSQVLLLNPLQTRLPCSTLLYSPHHADWFGMAVIGQQAGQMALALDLETIDIKASHLYLCDA